MLDHLDLDLYDLDTIEALGADLAWLVPGRDAMIPPVIVEAPELMGFQPHYDHDGHLCVIAMTHPSRPDSFFKVIDASVDGFSVYADACWHGELADADPHFLRIKGIWRLKGGHQLVEVERLEPVRHLSHEDLEDIAWAAAMRLQGVAHDAPTPLDAAARTLFATFGAKFMSPDLRWSNLLVRMEDAGPRLVISDPYASIRV